MEALFRFTLPTEPTALSALSGTILFTGATHHNHPAVQGWSLPVSKPGDVLALQRELDALAVPYTREDVDLPALLFGEV